MQQVCVVTRVQQPNEPVGAEPHVSYSGFRNLSGPAGLAKPVNIPGSNLRCGHRLLCLVLKRGPSVPFEDRRCPRLLKRHPVLSTHPLLFS